MASSQTWRWNLILAGLLLEFALSAVAQEAPNSDNDNESGVRLVGRTDDDAPLSYWYLYDAEGKKEVSQVYQRWGFTPVPPGEYQVKVRQGPSLVDWSKVTVKEGAVTTVKIDAGVELFGREDDESPLSYWHLFDAAGEKEIAQVYQRWGFTPVPPGEYQVKVRQGPSLVDWSKVTVKEGAVTTVKIDSGVELAGRTDDAPPLYSWYVFDRQGKEQLAYVSGRWGCTPVPAGEYVVKVRQGSSTVIWSNVTVKPGEVAHVRIDSGIELAGRTSDTPPLDYWYVFGSQGKEQLGYVSSRWGFTPVPPGKYVVKVRQGSSTVTWSNVTVNAGEVAHVRIDSGIELAGRTSDTPPLDYWYVFDGQDKEQLAYVTRRWGFTPVPPGQYVVKVRQGSSAITWSTVKVESGNVRTVRIDSGIELTGSTPSSAPPKYSYIYQEQNLNKPLNYLAGRWGVTPLPPGEYVVRLAPTEKERVHIRWAKVNVPPGQIATLNVEMSLADRFQRISEAGRKTEKELDPDGYKKLEEEVERAIRRGAAWLKEQSRLSPPKLHDVYATIGILALVHAGELGRDTELAQHCIDYLQRRPLHTSAGTYATALTAMALRDIDPYRYRQRIFECAQWLVENQGFGAADRLVWGYGDAVPGVGEQKELQTRRSGVRQAVPYSQRNVGLALDIVRQGLITKPSAGWDNSCTQFAVLGLHSSATSGVTLPRETWQLVDEHFGTVQVDDGGWGYNAGNPYGSMTCAGLASRVIARHHLGVEKPNLDPSVVNALEWLAAHFTVDKNPKSGGYHYYYLYGLERAGILTGTEFFGDQEWYPTGARYLLREQGADGAWRSKEGGGEDYLDTCYAILFLRRATLPLEPAIPALLSVTYEGGMLPPAMMPAVELVFDSSASMKELVDETPKINIARDVTDKVLGDLPDHIQLGLRLYGHWGVWIARKDNPKAAAVATTDPRLNTDSDLVVPIGPLDRKRRSQIKKWLDFAAPRGNTPLVYSLLQAKRDFPSTVDMPKSIVLVSDGKETCGGKLEDVARAYRDADIDIVIHVVGFDVEKDEEAKRQLQQIARSGGGIYFNARKANDLTRALRQAIPKLSFVVKDSNTGSQVAHGAVNGEPVILQPGRYNVQLDGFKANPVTVELNSEESLELWLDEQGTLRVP